MGNSHKPKPQYGVCYTKEMQEQAAPPRFRGNYPHTLSVETEMLPSDEFFGQVIQQSLKDGFLKQVGNQLVGKFPKLVLQIYDEEITRLAGKNNEDFDDIDCQDIRCTCDEKPRYLQLFADTSADRDSIVYNNCKRTLFAAAKRQIKSAPVPELSVAADFNAWAIEKIEELIGEDLNNFGYSFNQWYNHLNSAKQKRMDKIREFFEGNDPLSEHYGGLKNVKPSMFHYEAICKIEVQGIDGKPRMVCSIPDLIKYVMGPVCWKLEELFSSKIPTYCGGQNLQQMQDKINGYIRDGFVIVAEGDGSAFDNTQDVLLKRLDRYIYERIAGRIYHVPIEIYRYVSQAIYKTMSTILVENKHRRKIMTYSVLGTVFSGDCDTTLMNTLRMGFYNWYTNERCGLSMSKHFVCFSKGDDFTVMYRGLVSIERAKAAYRTMWLGKPDPNGPAYDGVDERIYGLGQILKFIEFGDPNTIKFCSLRAWYKNLNTYEIYLTRDPAKFLTLSKYARKPLHFGKAKLAAYLLDQAQAIMSSYKGLHYFESMAKAYSDLAVRICSDILARGGKLIERSDRRRTLPLEPNKFDGWSYEPRANGVKITGSYWETVKRIEMVNNYQLTEKELQLINQQISLEFPDDPYTILIKTEGE